ncbi:MAG: hypothetical protein Q8N56_00195 [bacterium]|nr:hypothetical protein [bacterium]
MEQRNPVEELFTDSGPFDQAEIVKVLKPLISIMRNNRQVFFLIENQRVVDKILAFALLKKLLFISGQNKEEGSYISAAMVSKNTDLPKGSIDTSFKQLRESKYLIGEGKEYEIPNSKIPQVLERLRNIIKVDAK